MAKVSELDRYRSLTSRIWEAALLTLPADLLLLYLPFPPGLIYPLSLLLALVMAALLATGSQSRWSDVLSKLRLLRSKLEGWHHHRMLKIAFIGIAAAFTLIEALLHFGPLAIAPLILVLATAIPSLPRRMRDLRKVGGPAADKVDSARITEERRAAAALENTVLVHRLISALLPIACARSVSVLGVILTAAAGGGAIPALPFMLLSFIGLQGCSPETVRFSHICPRCGRRSISAEEYRGSCGECVQSLQVQKHR